MTTYRLSRFDQFIQKLGGYGSAKDREFTDALKKVGAKLTTWYEAVPYEGEPKQLRFELSVKRGLFSKDCIAAGNDPERLSSIASYMKGQPEYNHCKLRIHQHPHVVRGGDFSIVQRTAFKGGDREVLTNVITRFGGEEEDIECILTKVEEQPLGYFLSVTPEKAQALAEIVHVGATTPLSREKMVEFLDSMRHGAESRVATGDKKAESFVTICKKLGDYWRNMPNDLVHIKLAQSYHDEGLIEKAVAEYRKVIQIHPDNADYHYNLGNLLAENGKLADAIGQYIEAIRINPSHCFAYNNLGQVYVSQGKLDEAKEQFCNAIRIDPSKSQPHGNLGIVYYHQGLLDEAIAEYEQCLRLDPEFTSVTRDLILVAQDERNRIDELERHKVELWRNLSGSSVVRFWGISIDRMDQLEKEWEKLAIVYEPLRESFTQEHIDTILFATITDSKDLTLDQRAIADFALLAILDGCIPPARGIQCLTVGFHSKPDFLKALLLRCVPPA